ncbi:unnamed protein product [Ostreobium quekettii]|uniref:Protein kinase domain-containing protein n=1 Tax=Ostreobium quekettii TaxID=121088 RepID=A0A8S1IVF1_9CHLO|nr:unnamed protein product [Ostreobium quekettii]
MVDTEASAEGLEGHLQRQQPLYNKCILGFLHAQLEKLQKLETPATATAKQKDIFYSLLGKGARLIAMHNTRFDFTNFHRTQDVCETVEKILKGLKETLDAWGLEDDRFVNCNIPSKLVEEDEELLRKLLNFVLKEVPCEIEDTLKKRWEDIKTSNAQILQSVGIVDEQTLEWGRQRGQGSQGAVFEASWGGAKVAVKKFISRWQGDLPIENFAFFLNGALMHTRLHNHPNIIRLFAATASGCLIMEWADSDLHTLCCVAGKMSWSSKSRLLRQGAAGLAHIHAQNLMHGSVKPPNFLIIGTDVDNCRLKIGDFALSLDDTSFRSKCGKMDRETMAWSAPEVLQDNPIIDRKSDVYCFGVACYEVVSGQQPFDWENTTVWAMIRMKSSGEEPCTVGPHDCPPQMLELMRKCCAKNPADRPTMEDVSNMLLHLPEHWSSISDDAGNSADSAQEGRLERPQPLYNRRIVGFLQDLLRKLQQVDKPATATDYEWDTFKSLIGKGERLVVTHTTDFDIRDFDWPRNVCDQVGKICVGLKGTLGACGLGVAERIVCSITNELVEEDEQLLHKLLNYVLKEVPCDIEDGLKQRWEHIKMRHAEILQSVGIVDEQALQLGEECSQGGRGQVFEASWRGGKVASWREGKVAVKKFINQWQGELPIESFALFLKQAISLFALNGNEGIIALLATTTSGWMVMELADTDLHTLCHDGGETSWRSKASLLQQGAEGLAFMHKHGFVHGDVNSRSFVVVGTEPDNRCLKIGDFGLSFETPSSLERTSSFEIALSRSKSATFDRERIPYVAPEVFDNKPNSQESDVYGFGVVCYEVISGKQPYDWKNKNLTELMEKIAHGEVPCEVAPGACPPQMMDLMKKCCALNPADRPTMESVKSSLRLMPEEWSPVVSNKGGCFDPKCIANEAHRLVHTTKYNKQMLLFLCQQMENAMALVDVEKSVFPSRGALCSPFKSSLTLITRHAKGFDFQDFYMVEEAKEIVEDICATVRDILKECNIKGYASLETRIPGERISEDLAFLKARLNYMFEAPSGKHLSKAVDELRISPQETLLPSTEKDPVIEAWEELRSKFMRDIGKIEILAVEDLELGEEIEANGRNTVLEAQWTTDSGCEQVAVKKLNDGYVSPERLANFFGEVILQRSVAHTYTVEILGIGLSGFIVMKLATGNLFGWCQQPRDWPEKIRFLLQAALGLLHLHENHFVHRDIKPENFLVYEDEPIEVRLCDFEMAINQMEDRTVSTLRSQPGTKRYRAPELRHGKPHSRMSDVFSFGLVMCAVVANKKPYGRATEYYMDAMKAKGDMPCFFPDDCPKDLKQVIRQCLAVHPRNRPTMKAVVGVLEVLRNVKA